MNKLDHGITATHVYGTAGLIGAVVGLIGSYKGTDGIYGWLLLASGWLVSAFMTWFLIKISRRLTDIIEGHDERTADLAAQVASLKATIEQQKNLIDQRSATLDFLSSLLISQPATPRQPAQPIFSASENDK